MIKIIKYICIVTLLIIIGGCMPAWNNELGRAINEGDGIKASAIIQESPDSINGKSIKNKRIENLTLHDIVIKDVKWEDFEISNSMFENVKFYDSSFKGVQFKNTTFKNCTFSNVTMEHTIADVNGRDDIKLTIFKNCLFLTTFFNNGCTLYNIEIISSKEGSNLNFNNVHFGEKLENYSIMFRGAKLDNLTIENSSAQNVDLGRSTAKTLLLNNNKNFEKVTLWIDNADSVTITNNKDFVLSLSGTAKNIYVDNNENISLGLIIDADNVEVRNTYGEKGAGWVEKSTNGVNFRGKLMKNILVDQFKNTNITLSAKKINKIKIMNGQGYKFTTARIDIDQLEMSNYVINKLDGYHTVIDQFIANDFTITTTSEIEEFTIKNKEISNFNVPKHMFYEGDEEQGIAFWKEFWATENK